jgi:hypothetical protein
MAVATLLADTFLHPSSLLLKLTMLAALGAVAYSVSLRFLHRAAWDEILGIAPAPARELLKKLHIA